MRRDNVEHLLVIGGSTDVVVEQNIVRAPQRDQAQRGPLTADAGRGAAPDATWNESESRNDALDPYEAQPVPEPPVLRAPPPRPSLGDEARRATPPMPDRAPLFPERATERSRDPLAGFAPEPPTRPEPRTEPRLELPSRPAPRPEPPRENPRPPMPPMRSGEKITRAAPVAHADP